jgi:hypothetical protein
MNCASAARFQVKRQVGMTIYNHPCDTDIRSCLHRLVIRIQIGNIFLPVIQKAERGADFSCIVICHCSYKPFFPAFSGDKAYKLKSDSLVNGLGEVQDVLLKNGYNGYLSAYPENLINRNIAGQRVWAPWYTLHKIYAGLIDQYLYCDNEQALDIVVKAAGWAYDKLMPLSEEQRKVMLRNEFGGVNEAFYNLYAITGNPTHISITITIPMITMFLLI